MIHRKRAQSHFTLALSANFNGFADCSAKPFLYYVYVQSLRQAQ